MLGGPPGIGAAVNGLGRRQIFPPNPIAIRKPSLSLAQLALCAGLMPGQQYYPSGRAIGAQLPLLLYYGRPVKFFFKIRAVWAPR